MPNLTIRASHSLLDELDAEADEQTGGNRAAYVRELLENRHASDERADALEAELAECQSHVDDLETDLERCRRARRQLLEQRDEHGELVAAVERERSLEERRASAGVIQRFSWWLRGMSDDD
jgi:chromosome segregation ATPase